jgi:hypothetical protein
MQAGKSDIIGLQPAAQSGYSDILPISRDARILGQTEQLSRKARLRSMPFLPDKRSKVIARDGLACWLCGLQTGSKGRMLRTLDHVIPVSRGGTDALENLRLAHLICNTLRADDDGATAFRAFRRHPRQQKWSHPATAAYMQRLSISATWVKSSVTDIETSA